MTKIFLGVKLCIVLWVGENAFLVHLLVRFLEILVIHQSKKGQSQSLFSVHACLKIYKQAFLMKSSVLLFTVNRRRKGKKDDEIKIIKKCETKRSQVQVFFTFFLRKFSQFSLLDRATSQLCLVHMICTLKFVSQKKMKIIRA